MLTRRAAREDDVPFLRELRAQTMNPHQLAMGIAFTEEEHERRVRSFFDSAQILEIDGEPVGLLKILREPDVWHIVQIQISPAHQGAGIGGALIRSLMDEARAAGVPLALTVLKQNPARRLYERLGFTTVGEDEIEYEMRCPVS